MHFGEYELFPSLIGLSPLPTTHPKTFQRLLVRSSMACYRNFNLVMGRSQGFASAPTDLNALFGLAFAADSPLLALAPTACKRMVSGTFSLPCPGCFSPFPHGTGSLSVSWEYLALADGPARFPQGFSCPAVLRVSLYIHKRTNTGLSPSVA